MLRSLAAALSLLLAPAAAPAQDRTWPIDEMAADLAYGFCPLFLAGQFSLTGPELAERGFGTTIAKQPHPRVGEMSLVSARQADGAIAFGGASGKACTVVVTSPKRSEVLARLRQSMAYMGLDFQPADSPGPAVAGVAVETFKAPAGPQILYVQLIQTGGSDPSVAALLFAMEQ